ncbi:MAG: hypothetical protein AAB453_03550 [Patescibacteria group bacterium]
MGRSTHGQLGGDAQTAFLRAPVCDKHAGWRICPHQGQDPASLEVSDVDRSCDQLGNRMITD